MVCISRYMVSLGAMVRFLDLYIQNWEDGHKKT